ncbi:3-keto-disaccharide hydrolase [Rosistilla oblonga]|uniref:3-keto-disaccharide hydrolase n=1 Tax=Rosistilla oblonga TaxID=2527990 RepID=UPI003A983B71
MFGWRLLTIAAIAITSCLLPRQLSSAGTGSRPAENRGSDLRIAAPDISSSGWKPMVELVGLLGWVPRNGTATYHNDGGQIVGRSVVGSPTSLLCTEKEYADFELTFEVLLDDKLNSGVQVRSFSKKDVNGGRVCGPQIEIEALSDDPNNACESGYIYSEGTGRGWLSENRIVDDVMINGQWNRFVIRVVGPRIQTWVNGRKVEDLLDENSPATGFIGLQVHSVPNGTPPLEVRWRDLRIRELPTGG